MRRGAKFSLGCALVLAAAALPATASAATLYDQTGYAGATSAYSMGYAPPNDTQVADDFTVPAGQTWAISEVDVLGSGAGAQKINVDIYANAGTLPGSGELFEQKDIVATGGPNYNTPLSNVPALGPGTYWISVQVAFDFWGWQDSTVQVGNPAAFENPSGGLYGCGTSWTARSGCVPGTAAEPDQAFRLLGNATVAKPSNQFSFGKVKLNKKKGFAALSVTVSGPGTLAFSGKGLKTVKATAGSAGTLKLKLKATGKARKKLNKTGKAKVKASVTFTPTGGDPATQVKSVTLKKAL